MAARSLRILLLGDASNFHSTLATALRSMGHRVTVASDGTGWMDTPRDIDLNRGNGKLGGLALWLRMRYRLPRRLSGYDIVSIAGTHFAALRPQRLSMLFDMIRASNAKVFMTALATDSNYIDECFRPDSPLSYSEWQVDGRPTPHSTANMHIARDWQSAPLRDYCNHLTSNVDGVVTALYEYHLSYSRILPPQRLAYGGIPIDTSRFSYIPTMSVPSKVNLFLGYPSARALEKGADRLLHAARRVAADYPDRCNLDVVSNVPFDEFTRRLASAHVVIDQLYSYTPATTALMAMAMGKTVLSGAEPQFYDFIGEKQLHPVINVTPRDDRLIYEAIKETVLNPSLLARRGAEGREFVMRHNDSRVVARRYLDFWQRF